MPDLETFREETRRWLDANAPASMRTLPKSPDDIKASRADVFFGALITNVIAASLPSAGNTTSWTNSTQANLQFFRVQIAP